MKHDRFTVRGKKDKNMKA